MQRNSPVASVHLPLPAQDQDSEQCIVQGRPEGQGLPPKLGRRTSWLQFPAVFLASL